MGGRISLYIDFILEERTITIPKLIHIIAFDQASMEPPQNIVFSLTQDDLVIHEEQTQNPQEQVLQEPIPLRISTIERINVIPDEYLVFLLEHEENNGMMEDDPIKFL